MSDIDEFHERAETMKCKVCGTELILQRDLPNIKLGDKTCMPCWREVKHSYVD